MRFVLCEDLAERALLEQQGGMVDYAGLLNQFITKRFRKDFYTKPEGFVPSSKSLVSNERGSGISKIVKNATAGAELHHVVAVGLKGSPTVMVSGADNRDITTYVKQGVKEWALEHEDELQEALDHAYTIVGPAPDDLRNSSIHERRGYNELVLKAYWEEIGVSLQNELEDLVTQLYIEGYRKLKVVGQVPLPKGELSSYLSVEPASGKCLFSLVVPWSAELVEEFIPSSTIYSPDYGVKLSLVRGLKNFSLWQGFSVDSQLWDASQNGEDPLDYVNFDTPFFLHLD